MVYSTTARNTSEKNAQKYFRKTEPSDTLAKKIRKAERITAAALMTKLRAQRLAKESADKDEADKLTAGQPAISARPRRRNPAATAKPPKMMRLVY